MLRKEIYWIWNASKEIHPCILVHSLAGILSICSSLLFVWVCKQLVDIATRTSAGSIKAYIAGLAFAIVCQLCLSVWESKLESRNSVRLKNKLQYVLFSHLMSICWNGREHFHSGDAVNRLEEDVRVVTDSLCSTFPSVWVTCFQLAAAFFFLLHLNSLLACILLVVMPAFLIISKFYMKSLRRLTISIRNTDSSIQSHIQENLQHKTLIQTLEQNPAVSGKLGILQGRLYMQVMKRTNFTLFSRATVMAGFATGYSVAFIWGVKAIYNGSITFGVMTAFLQLVGMMQRPIVDLSRQIPTFVHALASVERLLDLESQPAEEQGKRLMLGQQAGIRLRNLSFAYPDGERPVIRHFSFDFTPGSHTAIMGETGAGKSTLIRLMLSLLQPQEGEINLYNGQQEIKASPLARCNLVYVPQGNTLLSGTIRDNLLLGNPAATDKELYETLRTAAAEFVYSLPEKLDTICGEGGAGLSEGQAQRICIARGLLRPGSILLLDELSSSLDKETERVLIERLVSQTRDKTLIFITHRELIAEFCEKTIRL